MFGTKLQWVILLGFVLMLGVSAGCEDRTAKEDKEQKAAEEALLSRWDAANGVADVKMTVDGKEKTLQLAEDIEYVDSAGNVASEEVFASGDTVLIVETKGVITKMTKKEGTETAKPPENKGNTAQGAKVSKSDQAFVQAADQIDMAEVKTGKLAQTNAASDAVKKFAERMVTDHTKMNEELRAVASKKGITLAESLDPAHQELLDQLSSLKGAKFDQAYTKDIVAGHEQAIATLETEVKSGQDADVKAWAEKWLPTAREHLALAQEAANEVNSVKKVNADQAFVQVADQIDMAEVKIGKVAQTNAASDVVKKFGERMVTDHSKMNEALREVATNNGITLAESLDPAHQELLDQLSALKGAAFDQVYTKDMVAGHEKAIATFETEIKSGANPDVKVWAEKWVPTLREHLALAQEAVQDVNNAKGAEATKGTQDATKDTTKEATKEGTQDSKEK